MEVAFVRYLFFSYLVKPCFRGIFTNCVAVGECSALTDIIKNARLLWGYRRYFDRLWLFICSARERFL